MATEKPLRAQAESEATVNIPLDLSDWVPAAQLREWILADVANLNWSNPELLEVLRKHPEFEPKALLNTMTFAYATGVFGADEVERRCSVDLDFRGVRPKLPPIANELKKFRKENLGLMKWCLVNAISRALKTQFIEGESIEKLPVGLRRRVIENASERLELARHVDRGGDMS